MAFAWRLADPRFAGDLQGTGNRQHGARWNSPGRGVVYCSENLSLCILEAFVHLPPALRQKLPPRMALRIEYPDAAVIEEVERLPTANQAAACRALGDRWLDEGRALILRAPSIVVALEHNLMFNPQHAAMASVRIAEKVPFAFDTWMSRGHP
jgi:RES domain-containing protein